MTEVGADAQRELYGETWAARFGRLRAAYRLSQGALASAVGLSAPMTSQLVSGQRVKISNPAVLARIVHLEERLEDAAVASGDVATLQRIVAEVGESTPVLRTTSVSEVQNRDSVVRWLRDHAAADDLAALAEAAQQRGASLVADVLQAAATP